MFSFDGVHRKKPQQLLRGTHHVEQRNELLQRAAEDRRQREELRRKIESSVKIQALVRMFLVRNRQRGLFLREIENAKLELSSSQTVNRLLYFVRGANVFLLKNAREAEARAVFLLCQTVIRLKEACLAECAKDDRTAVTLTKFIAGSLRLVADAAVAGGQPKSSNADVNSVLRLVEIFLANSCLSRETQKAICIALIQRGFFRSCLAILISRSSGLNLSLSSTPAGVFQKSLFTLLVLPLNILLDSGETESCRLAVSLFCAEVLSAADEEIVRGFVVRSVAEACQTHIPVGVFVSVLAGLIGAKETSPTANIYLCWSLIFILHGWTGSLTNAKNPALLRIINFALAAGMALPQPEEEEDPLPENVDADFDAEEDVEMTPVLLVRQETEHVAQQNALRQEIHQMLESPSFVAMVLANLEVNVTSCVEDAAGICTSLTMNRDRDDMPSLFYKFAFNMGFLRSLWRVICEFKNVMQNLMVNPSGWDFAQSKSWIRLYSVFCRLLICTMATVYDDEFSSGVKSESGFEFSLQEVVDIAASARDVASGLVFLTYTTALQPDPDHPSLMAHLFTSVVQLIKELHDRDARRAFCVENFWNSPRLSSLAERTKRTVHKQFIFDIFAKANPFRPLRNNSSFAGATVEELRFSLVLDQMPCLIPFPHRLLFVYLTLKAEKSSLRSEFDFLRPDAHIQVKVRREYIYEDAFTDLESQEAVPDMRKSIKVTFQNLAGLDEAGVDGGGLFREFMNQTLRAGFDPNRGIFRNNQDAALFPNPEATILFPANFPRHFFFLGRLLGKAIYENLLTELHFAGFFLKKLLAKNNLGNVDIHYLKSLDPMLFKNLLYLKQYSGDVADLQLDFSAAVDEMGVTRQLDLKPNGRNILVTKDNVVEYIFLMADFKLNRQIRLQTTYFRDGVNDVVPIQLLQIFNFKELQTLISGTDEPIDVRDWRKNTSYGNPYSEEHPTIQLFWSIVQSFSEESKRKLLKFVTSCSHPPLLGFKDLPHKFTINPVTGQDRLPTASTCMNLLKLPNISDEAKLRQKLLYAIESDSGFELS